MRRRSRWCRCALAQRLRRRDVFHPEITPIALYALGVLASACSTTRSACADGADERPPRAAGAATAPRPLRGELSTGVLEGRRLARPGAARRQLPGSSRRALAARGRRARAGHQRVQPARPAARAARRRRSCCSAPGWRSARRTCGRCGRSACSPARRSSPARYDLRERAMLGDTGANLLGALAGLWLVLTLSGTGQLVALALLAAITLYGGAPIDLHACRTDSGAARTRLLGQALMTPAPSDRHAQAPAKTRFIFVTGGVVSSLGKGIAAASIGRLLVCPRADRRPAEVRPLHQRRPGHDVALPARRGVRHRGRRRDRPRPRPLRALHRRQHEPRLERDRRRDLRHRDPPRAPRRLPRRHRPGRPAHHRRDQAADRPDRRVQRRRLRDHRDRRHRRRHRVAAVPRGDPPVPGRRGAPALPVHPPHARALRRPRGRAEDEAHAALGQRAAPHRDRARHADVPLRERPLSPDIRKKIALFASLPSEARSVQQNVFVPWICAGL